MSDEDRRVSGNLIAFLKGPEIQFSSVTQLCLTLCNPMNRSMPGLPVQHQLPDSTQTHVYRVSDAIQPSHPLSSLSPPALNQRILNKGFQPKIDRFFFFSGEAEMWNFMWNHLIYICSPNPFPGSTHRPQFINSGLLRINSSPQEWEILSHFTLGPYKGLVSDFLFRESESSGMFRARIQGRCDSTNPTKSLGLIPAIVFSLVESSGAVYATKASTSTLFF